MISLQEMVMYTGKREQTMQYSNDCTADLQSNQIR